MRLLQLRATQLGAQSWVSNRTITWDPNHNGLSVEVHHVFPKAWMRKRNLASHPELDTSVVSLPRERLFVWLGGERLQSDAGHGNRRMMNNNRS
jgi:hypothetical protein